MHICIWVDQMVGLQKTGIGYYQAELVKKLAQIDCDNNYSLLHIQPAQTEWHHFAKANSNFQLLRLPLSKKIMYAMWHYFQRPYADHWLAPQVDLFHMTTTPVVVPTRIPQLVTVHDLASVHYPEHYPWRNRVWKRRALQYAIDSNAVFLSDSFATKQDLINMLGIEASRIFIVHLGVDLERFSLDFSQESQAFVEKRYSLKQPFILFVGALSPRKNPERIVQAFISLRQRGYSHRLVFVGANGWGVDHDVLSEMIVSAELEGQIDFLGYVPEEHLPIIYQLAELLLYPSLYEGFGFPILEAMACGTPVITSNISSMPELAGDAALLVDPYSVDEIVTGMKRIIDSKDERKRIAQLGLKRVQKFSWQKSVKSTLEIYQQLILE